MKGSSYSRRNASSHKIPAGLQPPLLLCGVVRRISQWLNRFEDTTRQHTYREGNQVADRLANWVLTKDFGCYTRTSPTFGAFPTPCVLCYWAPTPRLVYFSSWSLFWVLAFRPSCEQNK